MQSRCSLLSIGTLAAFFTFGPLALSASADNNDGATLPAPVKKSSQARPQNGEDHAGDKAKNSDAAPPKGGDGHNGGMMPPPPPRHGGSLMQMLDLTILNLSDDQKQKIQKLRGDSAIKARAIQRQLRENTNQMRDAMFDGTSTDAQIKAKGDEMKKSHEQFADSQLDNFLAIRALLTPEQKLKLKDVRAAIERRHDDDMENRHSERHHWPGGPPEGGPVGGGPGPQPGDKPADSKKKS